MSTRGDEPGGDYLGGLAGIMGGQSPAVKAAAARLAGMRGRSGTASRKPVAGRTQAYLEQTGRRELTPAQQRRVRKKGR